MSSTHDDRQLELRRAFAQFPTGVIGVCALVEGRPVGLAASSFTPVSLEPTLVSVCIGLRSTTWPVIAAAPRLGLSILGADQAELCSALAAKDRDRFADAEWQANADGAVFLIGASLWIETVVADVMPAGDHSIVLMSVISTVVFADTPPLLFHRSVLRPL